MTDETTDQTIETTSLSDMLSGASHEAHQEAGSDLQPIVTEAPAPAPEPAPQPAPVAETPPAAAPAAVEEKTPYWFRQAQKKEREQRQAAEQRAQQLERELQAARGAPAPQERPDPYENPDGFADQFDQRLAAIEHRNTVMVSERFARMKHGDETWEDTQEWLKARPDMVAWARNQSDPCEAAIQQYKREQLADEIGTDPAAYRARIEAEIRASVLSDPQVRSSILAEMGAVPAGQSPQTQQRPAPPPGAATARSAAPRGGDHGSSGPTPLGSMLNQFK